MDITVAPDEMSGVLKQQGSRALLPTVLGTRGLREIDAGVRQRAFFSARNHHVGALGELKELAARYAKGGYKNDLGQLRVEARKMFAKYGYDAAKGGFPGDDKLNLPPVQPGSMRDLMSTQRLNLIFKTQFDLAKGEAQWLRGNSDQRLFTHPAWELVTSIAEEPRIDWPERWERAGGRVLPGGRLAAAKWAAVWWKLGDSRFYDDALDTNHPPYAFQSTRIWRELTRAEAREAGLVRLKRPAGYVPDAPPPLEEIAKEYKAAVVEAMSGLKLSRKDQAAIKRAWEKAADAQGLHGEDLAPERAPRVERTEAEKQQRRQALESVREKARAWLQRLREER